MTDRILPGACLALLLSWSTFTEGKVKDVVPPGNDKDAFDFVYLGESCPVLIRLHVRVQGKRLSAVWDEFVTHLFKQLDTNGDGFLNKKEAARMPAPPLLFGNIDFGIGLDGEPNSNSPTLEALDTNKDGKVSRAELDSYLRRSTGAPFQFQFGKEKKPSTVEMGIPGLKPPATVADLNKEMLRRLDTDRDGKLSKKELLAAPAILAKLDLDEDEMIARQEILPNAATLRADGSAFQQPVPVDPKVPSKELARALLGRYGSKTKTSKLLRKEIGLDEATFNQLDRNKDGWLDAAELSHFAQRPPDLELLCQMGEKGSQNNDIALFKGAKRLEALGAKVRKAAAGASILEIGTELVHVHSSGADKLEQLAFIYRQIFVAQFSAADLDKNGYVDADEAKKSNFGPLFAMMDGDGDGKVFLKELEVFLDAVLDLQTRATASTVSLTFADEGRSLFDLVDSNRDGRLSVRELRQLPKLLERYDRNRDAFLSLQEIPRNLQLTLKQGLRVGSGGGEQLAYIETFYGSRGSELLPASRAGPLWFRKMDKNRDGDVSRKEFFGSDDQFRRIDTDGDGLISLEEANRFDAVMRKSDKKAP